MQHPALLSSAMMMMMMMMMMISHTHQRRVECRAIDADAGVRVLVGGRVRGAIDANPRRRQPGVG
jgi:hypothetical protein